MQELYNSTVTKRALSPIVATDNTALTTQIIDTKDFGGVMFHIATGTLADTDATFAVTAAESDNANMSSPSDVADGNMLGSETLASFQFNDDDEIRKLLITPTKRYVQLTITPSGNSGNAPLAAFAQLFGAKYLPATQGAS